MSLYPSLTVVHLPGRALWFCDILSRHHDNVIVPRSDTKLSKEQSTLIPSLQAIKPGAVLRNQDLLDLFAQNFGPELFDVSNSDYHYIQKVDWNLYTNPAQFLHLSVILLLDLSLVGSIQIFSRSKSRGQDLRRNWQSRILSRHAQINSKHYLMIRLS